MRIEILKINQQLNAITGTSKNGFEYCILQWNCNIKINNNILNNAIVKYLGKSFNLEIKEYEVELQTYQNVTSYMIKKEKKGSSWNKKPSYTLDEYNKIYDYALNKFKIKPLECDEKIRYKLFATYFIGLKDQGIKL